MWILRNIYNNQEKCVRIIEDKIYRVGRKESDLHAGGNDCSISRHHAEICLVTKDGEEFVQAQDKGSRYGTYVNNNIQPVDFTMKSSDNTNSKMEPNTVALLKHGDKIRFGLQWHIWFVYKYSYVVSSSKLDPALTTQLKQTLEEMKIPFQSEWNSSCTHLTMSGIVVTPKVVSTLASTKHIVTPNFWTDLSQVLTTSSGWYPKEENYLPPVIEQAAKYENVSFLPNPQRQSLFAGLKFVALSQQQMKYLEQCVTLAGGTIVNMNRVSFTKKELLDEKTIVLIKSSLHVESQQTQVNNVVNRIKDLFAQKEKRLVDESELGYAIMFASRESACNPYVAFTPPQSNSQTQQSQNTTVQQDSHVFSVSMITTQKTPRSTRKRERSPPASPERRNKKTSLAPLSEVPESETNEDAPATGGRREVVETLELAHSEEMMTFRDTQRVQSEVYELEDVENKVDNNGNKDEIDGDATGAHQAMQSVREKEIKKSDKQKSKKSLVTNNDSSEDELENLFTKCQNVINKKLVQSRKEVSNDAGRGEIVSSKEHAKDKKRNMLRSDIDNSSTELSDRTNDQSKLNTDDSIFNKPTRAIQSVPHKTKNNSISSVPSSNREENNTKSSANTNQTNATSTGRMPARSNLTKPSAFSNRSLACDSDDNEEDNVFGTTSTSLRGNTTLANSTRGNTLATNTTRCNNTLWNRTQKDTGLLTSTTMRIGDDDEDNVFGAPTIVKKVIDTTQFQTMQDTHTVESISSRTTMGSEGPVEGLRTLASQRSIGGGRKRLMEDEAVESFRVDGHNVEVQSLQDRGLLREDEGKYESLDDNCCVISVPFRLKKIPVSPRLENRKVFKKQLHPGRINKSRISPISFYPVFANILDDIKLESCT
uniref:Nibrin n=1 Tax=Cacopsylla melanoneura TaxID=428564 RepID=A0A8D8TGK3_9HEMI